MKVITLNIKKDNCNTVTNRGFVILGFIIMPIAAISIEKYLHHSGVYNSFIQLLNERGGMHQAKAVHFIQHAQYIINLNLNFEEQQLKASNITNISNLLTEMYVQLKTDIITLLQKHPAFYNLNKKECFASFDQNTLFRKYEANNAFRYVIEKWMVDSYNPNQGLLLAYVETGSNVYLENLKAIWKHGAQQSATHLTNYYSLNGNFKSVVGDTTSLKYRMYTHPDEQFKKVPNITTSDSYTHKQVALCVGGTLIFFIWYSHK